MPGFDYDVSISDFIDKELKKYSDEDMFWIYDKVLKFLRNPEEFYNLEIKSKLSADFIDTKLLGEYIDIKFDDFKNIKDVKNNIKISLEETKEKKEIEYFFKKINQYNNFNIEIFSFLKNNNRLCHFLINFIENNNSEEKKFIFEEDPYFYINYKFTFNKINFNKNKIDIVKGIFLDKITKNYYNNSKNFNENDFIKWAYSYLKNKNRDFRRLEYIPQKDSDYHLLIVSFLDYLLYFNKDRHYSLTNQLYKAWSQKKFRAADKTKKLYHLPLTKEAKLELKKLSDFKNKTENEILEELIHQMYLNEMCDEEGKLKY
ncbi:hypothetical protein [Acinetobacter guillouiae]|uniref:hypothetical protein n=1 Tax=Acinetobacter guillouiae TaxID=106649 RepID=UPI003AF5D05C